MLTTVALPADLEAALAAIDPTHMLTLTERLCAPDFAGRRVGTEAHARASAFLSEQFRQPGWNVTTQEFVVPTPVLELTARPIFTQLAPDDSPVRVLRHRTEFSEHPRSATMLEERAGPVVALAEQTSWAGAWIALEAVPQGADFTALAVELASQGALGFLVPRYPTADGYLVKRLTAAAPLALPVLSVRADLLPSLIGTSVRANTPVAARQVSGTNILAHLAGTEDQLAAAPLLIGAHYDAVGDDPPGGLRHPGATDNAAAIAVLLELARLLPHVPFSLRRSIVLVAFDAEEVGAYGSHALARQYKSTEHAPLLLNLDGAARQNEAVWVEPGMHTEPLLQALDQAGRWLNISLIEGNIASDQRQFTREGFSAVGLSVGAAKLHTPDDAIEQVQKKALSTTASLLLATLYQLV